MIYSLMSFSFCREALSPKVGLAWNLLSGLSPFGKPIDRDIFQTVVHLVAQPGIPFFVFQNILLEWSRHRRGGSVSEVCVQLQRRSYRHNHIVLGDQSDNHCSREVVVETEGELFVASVDQSQGGIPEHGTNGSESIVVESVRVVHPIHSGQKWLCELQEDYWLLRNWFISSRTWFFSILYYLYSIDVFKG